ncbi:cuticular protein 47Eg-like [Penaeus japonicus]|uniref:cuticular protein 47Eg-like n=1 Tax=Penaeus japonicus TaxID=27405 RepID=UPI001C70C4E1|nr:cuticular protein 47Eg-like [Penaeus japonicus]XP_042885191.1 cuticular protein 47Eg-like [Penaeus japonicus]
MKFAVVFFALFAVAMADDLELDLDDIHHDLNIQGANAEGTYSWTSPEGVKYFVRYIADDDGYRIVESNAVPASADGTAADGHQGSFVSLEDIDYDDDRK